MLLRLTGFLSGYAGVTPDLCRLLADRLNGGWFPAVPGGVSGAAGEIVPLAHLFGTLVGDGSVFSSAGPVSSSAGSAASSGGSISSSGLSSRPEAIDAGTALAQRGISPYELEAKEGIALINGAPLAPALAVPLALRAEALLDHATLCGALSIALTGASPRPYIPRIGELKGDPGQFAVHRRLWSLLLPTPDRLQDARQAPVSLRVIPQVHGAAVMPPGPSACPDRARATRRHRQPGVSPSRATLSRKGSTQPATSTPDI